MREQHSGDARVLVSQRHRGDIAVAPGDQTREPAVGVIGSGHTAPVRYAASNTAGTRILTASDDGMARVWLLELPDLVAAACRRTSRSMTPDEWKLYMGDKAYRQTCPGKPGSDPKFHALPMQP